MHFRQNPMVSRFQMTVTDADQHYLILIQFSRHYTVSHSNESSNVLPKNLCTIPYALDVQRNFELFTTRIYEGTILSAKLRSLQMLEATFV